MGKSRGSLTFGGCLKTLQKIRAEMVQRDGGGPVGASAARKALRAGGRGRRGRSMRRRRVGGQLAGGGVSGFGGTLGTEDRGEEEGEGECGGRE